MASNIISFSAAFPYPVIILGMGSTTERRRFIITPLLIGWAFIQSYPGV